MESAESGFRVSNRRLYNQMHVAVRKSYQLKNQCAFCGTKDKNRYELALKKGREYSFDVGDYIELCVPCHRKYDVTDAFKAKCRERVLSNLPDPKGERLPSQKGKVGGSHQAAKPIIQISKSGDMVKAWSSISDASRSLNISISAIGNCINGLSKSSGGFIWKFKD